MPPGRPDKASKGLPVCGGLGLTAHIYRFSQSTCRHIYPLYFHRTI